MEDVEIDLEEFKLEYLDNLKEEILRVESEVLRLEDSSDAERPAILHEIFRTIHSLKGSAGSYEFYMLTTIFHQFEDFINSNLKNSQTSAPIDTCLNFLDIAKNCALDYKNKSSEIEKYATILEGETVQESVMNGKILLIDSSKSIKKIITKVAQDNRLDIVILANGATALNRIIHERFDMIVTSKNLDLLDGESLLKGVRVMKNQNQTTPMVLISSDDYTATDSKKLNISFMQKDQNLFSNMNSFISKNILSSKSSEQALEFKKVFIAEDDLMIQKIVRAVFKRLDNVDLFMEENRNKGVKTIIEEKPDLIILDYFLKDCIGPDLLEDLFKQNGLTNTPVIFMTSSPENVKTEDLAKLGNVKGILTKPIKIRSFWSEINQIASID
jgi:DNA-binding response OmpR family regulator/HPt (histidine-containing phosphotransfer) domain-containing protein